MFSAQFKTSILDFMLGLGLENLDAYENVIIKSESHKEICVPFVCLTDSMAYIFLQTPFGLDLTNADRQTLLNSLEYCETVFVSRFEIRTEKVMLFAVNEQGSEDAGELIIYHRRPYSNNLTLLNCSKQGAMLTLQDLIATQESYFQRLVASSQGSSVANDDFYKSLSLQLDFSSNDGKKIKYDSDGNAYMRRKNNTWVRASNLDSTKLLYLTTLGGFLGAHLFYQNRKAKGILYLLTCGFFGIGWIIDAIELLLGLHKDKDGYYIIPPEIHFITSIACFAAGLLLTFGGSILYKFILSYGNTLLKNFAEIITSEWSSPQ